MDRDALARRWAETLAPFGAPAGAADEVFHDLAEHYSEPRRHYHTLEHVDRVLRSVSEMRSSATDPVAVELAAWLHDVIYDARAGDNEDRSAAYARDRLAALGVPSPVVAHVADLILATATQDAGDDPDAAVLLDADLAVLGAHPDLYDRYRRAVREEFAWLPEPEFRAGRAALLRRLLERDRIFVTGAMWSLREVQARRNMERELEELERLLRD